MNNIYVKIMMSFFAAGITFPAIAGVTFGDAESDRGALTVSGTVRVNYQDKNYGEDAADHEVKLDAAILNIDYDSPDWFAKLEYRCYQYDTFCDFSTLVYGYAGYRLNQTDQITLGIQPIPFGSGRFWDSSFFASINNTMGLQDVSNLGVKYHFEMPSATKIDLAYFATDGGNYHGDSKDAAHYTANVITSSDPLKTDLEEKNMWLARVDQPLNFLATDDFNMSIGASYWYSDIENNKTSADGSRNSWAVFNRMNYKNLNVMLTGGKQSISNKDALSPDISTFGSFDYEYDVANEGYFYTLNTSYSFKDVNDVLDVTPYIVFSGFDKQDKNFANSQRNIVGVSWSYKNTSLYTEYLMAKNDPFVGGTTSSLASGDDGKWNKLFNIMFIYNF